MKTDHMIGLGAEVVERDIFLDALEIAIEKPTDFGKWHDLKWNYHEGDAS